MCSGYEFLEEPLCVPHDPVESLEFMNFWEGMDDSISIDFLFPDTLENKKVGSDKTDHESLLTLLQYDNDKLNLAKNTRTKISKTKNITTQSSFKCRVNLLNSSTQQNQRRVAKIWDRRCDQDDTNTWERRCSHCDARKTPQWRTGPSGRHTLCNACGIRFKAGKLFPEYRPAESPSFDESKHSNVHRAILKMRGDHLI